MRLISNIHTGNIELTSRLRCGHEEPIPYCRDANQFGTFRYEITKSYRYRKLSQKKSQP
jgi:hypothetical protein